MDRRGEARLVNKLDALYAATGHPPGPDPWKVTDVIATGALVAGIFGKGGGGEVGAATSLQAARRGARQRSAGKKVWNDFRSADDPEAAVAPCAASASRTACRAGAGASRCPIPGSVQNVPIVVGGEAARRAAVGPPTPGAVCWRGWTRSTAGSNALVVSARESESGNPLAVFGPQTSYFAPQLLMEQDAHAPASGRGPGDPRPRRLVRRHQPLRPARARASTTPGRRPRRARTSPTCSRSSSASRAASAATTASRGLPLERRVPRRWTCSSTRTRGRRTPPT